MLPKSILRNVWFRAILLIIAFFFLALLFVAPPVRYSESVEKRSFTPFPETSAKDSPARELVTLEHQKALDEIKYRIGQQDSWYYYKFIFIGALLAVCLGSTRLLTGPQATSSNISYRHLKNMLTADSNYSVIALACVLSIIVDMRLRNHMFSMQTLGLWITNYVEPMYFPNYPNSGYYPWEQFLRNPNAPGIHLDGLYRIAFSIHLHFMTTIIYLLYIIVFQYMCLTFNRARGRGRRQIILFGFLFVHLSSLAFVLVADTVPSMYEMRLIPLNIWASGWEGVAYYLIPWLIIIALNVPYLLLIKAKKVKRSKQSIAITSTAQPNNSFNASAS